MNDPLRIAEDYELFPYTLVLLDELGDSDLCELLLLHGDRYTSSFAQSPKATVDSETILPSMVFFKKSGRSP